MNHKTNFQELHERQDEIADCLARVRAARCLRALGHLDENGHRRFTKEEHTRNETELEEIVRYAYRAATKRSAQ